MPLLFCSTRYFLTLPFSSVTSHSVYLDGVVLTFDLQNPDGPAISTLEVSPGGHQFTPGQIVKVSDLTINYVTVYYGGGSVQEGHYGPFKPTTNDNFTDGAGTVTGPSLSFFFSSIFVSLAFRLTLLYSCLGVTPDGDGRWLILAYKATPQSATTTVKLKCAYA